MTRVDVKFWQTSKKKKMLQSWNQLLIVGGRISCNKFNLFIRAQSPSPMMKFMHKRKTMVFHNPSECYSLFSFFFSSYLHCKWASLKELEKDPRIHQKIKRFRTKQAQMKHLFTEVVSPSLHFLPLSLSLFHSPTHPCVFLSKINSISDFPTFAFCKFFAQSGDRQFPLLPDIW